MKDSLISLFQARMDKCTTEQFWAVGVITGLSAFLISERQTILMKLPNWSVIAVQMILFVYGICFVVNRHKGYYKYECELRKLVKDETIAPEMLKEEPSCWEVRALIGVAFYIVWILLTSAGVIICYI